MTRRINQDLCIQCAACLAECFNGGIHELEAVYLIDPSVCRGCDGVSGMTRCEESCPVGAIEVDSTYASSGYGLVGGVVFH